MMKIKKKYQLKEWTREEKMACVPPSKGVMSNLGFFQNICR